MKGLILNIQRFSTHDGPGVRTAVFLKGCTNNCAWCHNPESIHPRLEVQIFPERCIGCGRCLEVCPSGAHQLVDGEKVYHRQRCQHCGRCAEECFSGALVGAGRSLEVGEVMAQILEDLPYYHHSQGGATFSGGEPLMQKGFLLDLLQRCQAQGVHTAVETAGNYPWTFLAELLPSIDLVMYDLKVADPERHRRFIGNDGERVRTNLLFLGASGKPFIVRTPVIGGINDTPEEIGGTWSKPGRWPPTRTTPRCAGDPISHSANPDPGFTAEGGSAPTAKSNAVAAVQPHWGNTTPLQLDIDAHLSRELGGIEAIEALIKGHNELGGTLININVLSKEQILEAHADPSRYPDLVVRVTGYSAYFRSLSPEYRQQVVDRLLAES